MKTQSAKAKGRRLQKQVVNLILDSFPDLTARDVQSRSMGAAGTDVILSEAAFKRFPWAVEAKNQERNKGLLDMWGQAQANKTEDGYTLLVLGCNNMSPLAVIDLNIFMKLVRENYVPS